MPQAIIAAVSAALVSIGVSATVAAVVATAVTIGGLSFVSSLLSGLLRGGARSERTERTIKSPTPPRTSAYGVRRLYGAQMLFDTASNGSSVDVWAFHDGRANAIRAVYLNDDRVFIGAEGIVAALPDGTYKEQAVRAGYNLGLDTETAHSWIVTRMPGIWTEQHRGDGIVSGWLLKAAVKSKDYLETFPQGDNVTMSLVGEWQLCFDPRNPAHDPNDRNSWTWTENAALHLLHYLIVRRGVDYEARIRPVLAYWIAAANHCDEAVPLAAGGTEPRYRGCVAYDHDKLPGEIISELLACFDGWTALDENGCHLVYSGRVYEPSVVIGPEQIIAYSLQSFVEDEDTLNELIVRYVSSEHDWATVDCQPWRDDADISARGKVNSDGFAPQVPSHTQARRLAKRAMARRNAPHRGRVTTNIAGRVIIGQRYIRLTIAEAGAVLFSGVAEIISAERDYDTGGVIFDWIAADPNMDAWNPATEDGEPAPVGNRVPVAPLDAPSVSSAVAIFSGATDQGTGVRVQIAAAGPDRSDMTWFARWRVSGGSTWNEQAYSDLDPGPDAELLTDFVSVDASVEVAVAYQIGDGRVSPWSNPPTLVGTETDATPPEAATTPTLTAWVSAIEMIAPPIARAVNYRWRVYADDGTTLLRTVTTATRSFSYTAAQAASDGIRRAYVISVAGVNAAGEGASAASAVLTNPPPPALSSAAAAGGSTTATISADASAAADLSGYAVFYSNSAGFDPATTGQVIISAGPNVPIYGLAAGTYYARIAAFDFWTRAPALLNLSAQLTFTITAGGGGFGGGGSGGGGGGGFPLP